MPPGDYEIAGGFSSLEIALLPPIIAFALFESLLWTARGFSAKQAVSKHED